MSTFLIAVFAFIVVLGPLVFVHELGHFLLAKLFKVRVLTFSLGFGSKLFTKNYGGTEYAISSIPLGGYVKMFGEQPSEEPLSEEEQKVSFSHKPVWQRFGIVAFGPIFNLLFAVFIYFCIFSVMGLPESTDTTKIGDVVEGSPAMEAGIKPLDEIIMIDGNKTESWEQVIELVQQSKGEAVEFVLLRDGKEIQVPVAPKMEIVRTLFGEETDEKRFMIGIQRKFDPVFHKVSIGKAFVSSFESTWNIIEITGIAIVKMAQRKVPASEMGGPIRIAEYAGMKMKSGWLDLVAFVASLSIGLGILNLLPIPVLDGGHLVFLTIEGIIREPLSDRTMEFLQKIGIVLLGTLMIFVFYNDILRLVQRFTG